MSSFYRKQLEQWLSQLDVKADRVLDVGGSQLPVKDRVKSWDVKEYKILDFEEPHKEKQKADYIGDINYPTFYNTDSQCEVRNNVNKYVIGDLQATYYPGFEIVFCLEVMEYIWNPVQAISELWEAFGNKKGILYITFPTVYPVHEPREQDYLRYTKQGAIKLLESTGFEVLEIIPRTSVVASLRTFYSAEKMRAAKGYDGHEDVGYIIKAQKV